MLGLILKDVLTILKQTKIYLLLIVFFTIMPGMNMTIFAVVYSALMPLTALSFDEQSKWNNLAIMMPYNNSELVISKYILGIGASLASGIICFILRLIMSAFSGDPMLTVSTTFGYIAVALGIICITLPFMFRFGVEKGRLVIYLLLGFFAAVGFFFKDKAQSLNIAPTIILVALLISIPVSVLLSMKGFEKRYLG